MTPETVFIAAGYALGLLVTAGLLAGGVAIFAQGFRRDAEDRARAKRTLDRLLRDAGR